MKTDKTYDEWYYTLFVKHADLFLPFLEEEKLTANDDVRILNEIFEKHQIKRGAKILDLSCGIRRHAITLHKMGYEMVGYDPSPLFLEKAKEYALESTDLKNSIRFYNGLPYDASETLQFNKESGFNAIIIMGNSIGYSSEDNDFKMLSGLRKVSADNCLLIVETENRDWRIKNFLPYMQRQFKNLEVHETWRFDFETSVSEARSRFYDRDIDGKALHLLLDLVWRLRLYSLHEVRRIMFQSGWMVLESYGRSPADSGNIDAAGCDSEHIITVSRNNIDNP